MTTLKPAPRPFRLPTFPPDVEAALDLLHPISRECLDPECVRFDLGSPFIVDGNVFATDGRIMVWTSIEDRPELIQAVGAITVKGKRPSAGNLQANILPLDLFEAEPRFPPSLEDQPLCPRCKGQRFLDPRRCECCDSYLVNHQCGECGGTGREESFRDSAGRTYNRLVAVVPGCCLVFRFIDMLDRHHALIRAPLDPVATQSVRFWCGDVSGVVMPLIPE